MTKNINGKNLGSIVQQKELESFGYKRRKYDYVTSSELSTYANKFYPM